MSLIRSAFVFVRPTAPDVVVDGAVVLSGHPSTPTSWEDLAVDAGWTEHRRPTGQVFHALRVNTSQIDLADGIWLIVQREPSGTGGLTALAGSGSNTAAASMKATWTAARAGNATAKGILRHWPDWKVTGSEPDPDGGPDISFASTVKRLGPLDSGKRLPASVLNGGAGPWAINGYTITAFHRPGLTQTIVGYDDVTPEAGTPED